MRIILLIILALALYYLFRVFGPGKKTNTRDPSGNAGSLPGPADDGSTTPVANSDSADAGTAAAHSEPAAATSVQSSGADRAQAGAHPGSNSQTDSTAAGATVAGTLSSNAGAAAKWLNSGDATADIREMLKILNLRDSDAPRLAITREQYQSLKSGDSGGLADDAVTSVANRLRTMLQ